MTGEWQLAGRSEYSYAIIAATLGRKQESGLGIVHLAGDVLHRCRIEPGAVGEDRQLVSPELFVGENIRNHELFAVHFNLRLRTVAIRLMPSSIISGFWFEKLSLMKFNFGSQAKNEVPGTKATRSAMASTNNSSA